MRLKIEINKEMLIDLVRDDLQRKLGDVKLDRDKLKIETKSKQNYKFEWEIADFRAVYEGEV